MNIRGIHKTSLIDFPGKICSVIFTGGCNLRCGYCHNPDLACNCRDLPLSSNEEVLGFISKRKNLIDGVTITGGEPTLSRNLDSFLERVKREGLSVKLDSNGLKPDVLERLLARGLVDYAAIDIKTSPEKYSRMTGAEVDFNLIIESVDVIRRGGIDYEARTTCVPGFVTRDDLESIGKSIGRVRNYYLQQFQHETPLLDHSLVAVDPYPEETLLRFREAVLAFADRCEIRGT